MGDPVESFEPVKYAMILSAENYGPLRDDPVIARVLLESHATKHPNPDYPLPPAWQVEDVTVELRTAQFNPECQVTVVVGVIVPG